LTLISTAAAAADDDDDDEVSVTDDSNQLTDQPDLADVIMTSFSLQLVVAARQSVDVFLCQRR